MNQRRNSNRAKTNGTSAPLPATVRKIAVRDGTLLASFVGMNGWYTVPAHLEPIIRQAVGDRTSVAITTAPNAVVTAEPAALQEQHRC